MEGILLILLGITMIALVLNMPFGYLRAKRKKFSFHWFLYIHLPIPFIFVLRTVVGLNYTVIPIIAMGAIIGQVIGGRIQAKLS